METVALTWTFRNAITIATMGVLVYLAATTAAQLWKKKQGA